MKQKLFLKQVLLGLNLGVAFVPSAYAETMPDENYSEEIQTLFGQACERVKPQETISSIRMRATDKATFEAVKNLEAVTSLQNQYDDHDLNVLVYKIVDNYVEDLGVQTTEQNAQKICVEITGYVSADNISAALNELKNEQTNASETEATNIQPLAEETNEEPSVQVAQSLPQVAPVADENVQPVEKKAQEPAKTNVTLTPKAPSAKLLYIAPLEFFNNTYSKEYVKILNRIFDNNAYYQITEDENAAGYVIYSKVLRAKVDAINSNTNRMQMVVSVEVKNKMDGSSAIEHQNRFILFNSNEDEQKVAANLMQKLLTKASKLILNKVERMARIQAEKNGENSTFIPPKEINPDPLPSAEK